MIKYDELKSQLRKGQFAPVYLLMGEEPFYIDRICSFFENKVVDPEARDFNQVVVYGKDTSAADITATAKEYPFGSPFRLVIVKEAKDLKDIDKLKAYVENPVSTAVLVICYKYGKLKAAQYKPYEKHGVVFESVGVKDWELSGWVQKTAQQFGFGIEPQTSSIFTEHIGNDLSRIYNEFEKLKVVLPKGQTITPDVVEKYVGISKEYNIFELQEALGRRDAQRAYRIALNFTQHLKENPNIKTILMLYNFYQKMVLYHLSPDKSQTALREIYGNLPPSIVSRNVGYAQSHTLPRLAYIMSVLREYDVKSKGVDTNCTEGELLKEMVLKILR